MKRRFKLVKRARVPVRIDFAGGTTDIAYFSHKYGGAVLNAAIDMYVSGKLIRKNRLTDLSYRGKIPTSSGLGSSGAMNVLWLALINKTRDKKEIADETRGNAASANVGAGQVITNITDLPDSALVALRDACEAELARRAEEQAESIAA